jgi:probable HAF family extracellular repeat protein
MRQRIGVVIPVLISAFWSGCSHDGTGPGPRAPSALRRAGAAQAVARYSVVALSTLGGASGEGISINNKGWVTGVSSLPNNQSEHAFLWRSGTLTDLGTLGGPNSTVLAAKANDRGEISGQAETAVPDPLHENFCGLAGPPGFNTGLICRGFLWRDGVMTALPTLGGNNAQAYGVNNRGQVVGGAETVRDPTCVAPQVLDYEAVIWGPEPGEVHELPPLPGDRVGGGIAINDSGQVAGVSFSCGPVDPARSAHAVLWAHGSVINLGSLGGALDNVPIEINNRGQVVGYSHLAGDLLERAFFWEHGAITDLGTLPGDVQSFALGIDEQGDAVGGSCDLNFNCRAVMWRDGVMVDLSTLVASGPPITLIFAEDINAAGEIVGQAFDPRTGDTPAFLAIPTSAENVATRTAVSLPENVRSTLRRRLRHERFE